jgi:outer membrane protein assembly factor BamB
MTTVVVGTDRGLHHLDGTIELAGSRVDHVTEGWAVGDGAIYATTADGWAEIDMSDRGHATCVAATASGALVGLTGAHLLEVAAGNSARVTSFEDAPTRPLWHTPWGGPPDVRSIAVAPDGTAYVNVHVGGILRGDDTGWHATIDLHTDVHQVIAVGDLVLAALGAGGLGISGDRGMTWQRRIDGLHASYCRAVAVAAGTVLVTASDGPHGSKAALYRAPLDGDAPFERCVDGLSEWFDDNIDTHTLAAHDSEAVFGTHRGTVYHSTDAGRSWNRLLDQLPPIRCINLTMER